ncbi:MAG: ACT domain-containing protein [Dehalococcoidia bacterium]
MAERDAYNDADFLRSQAGPAYSRFGPSEVDRHIALLKSVGQEEDVALHVESAGDRQWTVTVCTWDWLGTLSILAGLFTTYRLDILSVDVFTLSYPQRQRVAPSSYRRRGASRPRRPVPRKPRDKILDVFTVEAFDAAEDVAWPSFRQDLAALVGLLVAGDQDRAREEIIDRFAEAARGATQAAGHLLPVSIEIDNEASSEYTRLEIRSQDTPGFLFAFTNALAALNINVVGAEIRTVGDEVQDTFWLTDRPGRKVQSEGQVHELRVATALIKHFTHLLPLSPNPTLALRQFRALVRQVLSTPEWTSELEDLESATVLETLAELMGVSQFLWEDFLRMQHENLYSVLVDIPALDQYKSPERLAAECRGLITGLSQRDERVRQLNRFKDREMFRVDLRHITGRIPFADFSRELSDLAEVIVREAGEVSRNTLAHTHGRPRVEGGRSCPWCICALGKFGGRELGFGSDVELLFVYEAEGTTDGQPPVPNSVYFGDFVRKFLRAIVVRRQGIFEVDLRLRPHSNAGPLATTMGGFKAYYADEGGARHFERLALTKLRPVAGDSELGSQVSRWRDSFVYSAEALDIENILHLRRRQASELVTPGTTNAKYSPGGLVDVEYFVQARQIVVGHKDVEVRVTNTLDAIHRLGQRGHLDSGTSEGLAETYRFLRRLIDALRVVRGDAKDLTIPFADSMEFVYLARRLDFAAPARLQEAIEEWMDYAANLWSQGSFAE